MGEPARRRVYRFDDVEWQAPTSPGTDASVAAAAARVGVGKKLLAQGDAGFYTQMVRFPSGFAAPTHSHDHAEVFVVLDGSCTFEGEPMAQWDLTVMEANQPYAFTAGPDGVQFLVIRTGAASATLVS